LRLRSQNFLGTFASAIDPTPINLTHYGTPMHERERRCKVSAIFART